jgi:hypothetical protein
MCYSHCDSARHILSTSLLPLLLLLTMACHACVHCYVQVRDELAHRAEEQAETVRMLEAKLTDLSSSHVALQVTFSATHTCTSALVVSSDSSALVQTVVQQLLSAVPEHLSLAVCAIWTYAMYVHVG